VEKKFFEDQARQKKVLQQQNVCLFFTLASEGQKVLMKKVNNFRDLCVKFDNNAKFLN